MQKMMSMTKSSAIYADTATKKNRHA